MGKGIAYRLGLMNRAVAESRDGCPRVYQFDAEGNVISETVYNSDGTVKEVKEGSGGSQSNVKETDNAWGDL